MLTRLTLTNYIDNDSGLASFTCDDGTCVEMNQRCDLQVDCPDSSDEKNCDVLQVPSDYRSQIFPIMSDGNALLVRSWSSYSLELTSFITRSQSTSASSPSRRSTPWSCPTPLTSSC